MQVYLKIHKNPLNQVVAICDEDLLGKKITNGKLEIAISENFYKGELVGIENALRFLERAGNYNIIGKDITDAAIKLGFLKRGGIINVNGVPMAMKFII